MTKDDPLLIGICEMNPAAEYGSNRFRWINNAYEILGKEETRRFWHRYLQRGRTLKNMAIAVLEWPPQPEAQAKAKGESW